MPIIRRSLSEILASERDIDWEKVSRTTDEDIAAQIAADPDTAPDVGDTLGDETWRKIYNPRLPDVAGLRQRLRLSRTGFARRFGFNPRAVGRWERGESVPDRATRILLRVIEKDPEAVDRALAAQ